MHGFHFCVYELSFDFLTEIGAHAMMPSSTNLSFYFYFYYDHFFFLSISFSLKLFI